MFRNRLIHIALNDDEFKRLKASGLFYREVFMLGLNACEGVNNPLLRELENKDQENKRLRKVNRELLRELAGDS